jgi:dTDP-4-dehydrorhamnose 3,5-epimerase
MEKRAMKITQNNRLEEVLLIETDVHEDGRGFFRETYQDILYKEHGIKETWLQDNVSFTKYKGTIRGLHFQHPQGQAKLITVLKGEIFDVVVDVRIGSKTHGQWTAVTLSESGQQLYIPKGFAHGFCTLTNDVLFSYKCSDVYNPECERVIAWNDPGIKICWPTSMPVLSKTDAQAPTLSLIDHRLLPKAKGIGGI